MAKACGVERQTGQNDAAFRNWASIELVVRGYSKVAGEVCVGKPEAEWDNNDRKVVLGLIVISRRVGVKKPVKQVAKGREVTTGRQRFARQLFGWGLVLIVVIVIVGLPLAPMLTGKPWPNGTTSLTYLLLVLVSCIPAGLGLLMTKT